jgi:hypothetical protein
VISQRPILYPPSLPHPPAITHTASCLIPTYHALWMSILKENICIHFSRAQGYEKSSRLTCVIWIHNIWYEDSCFSLRGRHGSNMHSPKPSRCNHLCLRNVFLMNTLSKKSFCCCSSYLGVKLRNATSYGTVSCHRHQEKETDKPTEIVGLSREGGGGAEDPRSRLPLKRWDHLNLKAALTAYLPLIRHGPHTKRKIRGTQRGRWSHKPPFICFFQKYGKWGEK